MDDLESLGPDSSPPPRGGRMRESVDGFSAEKLRRARAAMGWTSEQLAGMAGCSRSAIRVWESGRYGPTPPRAKAVAEALGKPLGDLVDFTPEKATLRQLRQLSGRLQRELRTLPGLQELGGIERGDLPITEAVTRRLATEYDVELEVVRAAAKRTRTAKIEKLRTARKAR